MIWTILIWAAIFDTIIGNRILPSKVAVHKFKDNYYVVKWQRIFFIPIKMYHDSSSGNGWNRAWFECDDVPFDYRTWWFKRRKGTSYTKTQAIERAAFYANSSDVVTPNQKAEEVWSSWRTKPAIPSEDELTLQLGEACIAGDKEKELELMSKLKEYKYI